MREVVVVVVVGVVERRVVVVVLIGRLEVVGIEEVDDVEVAVGVTCCC